MTNKLPAVQPVRWSAAVPPALQAIRVRQCDHSHDQLDVRGVGHRVRRCEDGNGVAGHIVETGNEPYRFRHSSATVKTRIRSRETSQALAATRRGQPSCSCCASPRTDFSSLDARSTAVLSGLISRPYPSLSKKTGCLPGKPAPSSLAAQGTKFAGKQPLQRT